MALCLIPLLMLGRSQFISYDAWWHIFIARIGNWHATFADIRDNAHPPLFYIVLHYIAKLGHGRLVYRSSVIIPGLAAVFYVGWISAQLFTSRAIAVLAAATYGLSMSFIELSLDVRSYPLALLFVLISSYYFLEWLRDPIGPSAPRAFLLSCFLASLGITTEYYAAFLLPSFAAIVVLFLIRYSEFRRLIRDWLYRHWKITALSCLIPLITIYILYRRHIRYLPKSFNHVSEYYWKPHTGGHIGAFLLTNLLHALDYFSPLPLSSFAISIAVCAALAALICIYAIGGSFSLRRMSAATPGLIFLILVSELAMGAVAGRYPFGGEMRQQSIIFPFLLLGMFALVDWMLTLLPRLFVYAACVAIPVAIGANFSYRWKQIVWTNEDSLFLAPYYKFVEDFPNAGVVYTDEFSSVFYLMGTNASRWTFARELDSFGLLRYQRIDEFNITGPAGGKQIFIRDKGDWVARLKDRDFYLILADTLRNAQVNNADLFSMIQGPFDQNDANWAPEPDIRALASGAGLSVDRVFLDPHYSFLQVHLRDTK